MKRDHIRPFDVLKNITNGELGLVIEFAGANVHLVDKTGRRALFKLGADFIKVDDDTGFRLAALNAMRERRRLEHPPKRKRAPRAKKKA
jgi:hypothetical protein